MNEIGQQPLNSFVESTPIEAMTEEEVLAVISGLLATEKMLDPRAVHSAFADGSFQNLLQRLDRAGQAS